MNYKTNLNDLAARLKNEAAENAPAFSPLLHARIMQGLTSGDTTAADVAPIHPRRTYRLGFAGLAAAASVALLLMFHPWTTPIPVAHVDHPAPVTPTPHSVPVPQFALVMDSVTGHASEQLDNARFAYLDQDAKHLARFMMHQMDVLPSSR
jgi:hypothetical protein